MNLKNTLKISGITAALVAVILAGCFIIATVNQPSNAFGGEQITTTVIVTVEGISDANPHYGIAGFLIPNDWTIDTAYFSGAYNDYMTFLDPDSADAEPGGQVDYWTDSLEVRYPSGPDYMWVVYQSSTSHLTLEDTADVTLTVKMTTSTTLGNFDLGYFVSNASLDFTDVTYFDVSLNNPITISIIPVELTSFSASVDKGTVTLNWETATETNNRGFEIERSTNSDKFTTIGFVPGKGTVTENNQYSFIDKNVPGGIYYYRLKQIDYDGKFEYSKTIEVDYSIPTGYIVSQNYPNPFNPSTSIEFGVPVQAKVIISLYNSIGEEVAKITSAEFNAGRHFLNFNADNLSSGTYIYTVSAEGIDGSKFVQSNKMILMK
jgi:hypothetical protein